MHLSLDVTFADLRAIQEVRVAREARRARTVLRIEGKKALDPLGHVLRLIEEAWVQGDDSRGEHTRIGTMTFRTDADGILHMELSTRFPIRETHAGDSDYARMVMLDVLAAVDAKR